MKKPTLTKLKKKAWKVFSLYIRTKYASPNGDVICYTCGKLGTIKTMQAGHGIGGRNNAILFEEDLVRPQCVGCNIYGGGKYSVFAEKLINELGESKYADLVRQSNTIVKMKPINYMILHDVYEGKLKTLLAGFT